MIFLTGVPGFLGTRLFGALADQYPDRSFGLLVQSKYKDTAQHVVNDLGLTSRVELFSGDITKPDLDLGEQYDAVADQITLGCHLAAVYDLSISRDVGWQINVEGTRHVLDLMAQCPHLERFAYVSTAYVSGRRTGVIYENELVHHAGFKNFYEETKYHAEVLVHDRMNEIPTTIFRPGIVVGDSETGETDKFDGPYYILDLLRRLPRYTLMTRVGSGQEPVNLVPVDFVVAAMRYLLTREQSTGTVFHLTDPSPLTAQELLDLFARLLDKKVLHIPIPPALARTLAKFGGEHILGLAPELIDYFDHPSRYDSSHTQRALADTDIACPAFPDYAPKMIEYMRRHTDVRSSPMY